MKIDRLIAIIVILLEYEVINARELAEKLEVSRRTIYRDIDTLTFAGLPIFTQQGASGGVGLMKSYKVDKKLFTHQDIQALVTSLKSYKQLFNHKDIVHVLEKLSAIAYDGGTSIPEGKFVVDLSLNQGNESLRSLLSHVETALNEERYLSFDYVDSAGHISSRKIEPYRVVFKESSWYLQGYCVEKMDYRIFKLARMSKLQVLRETFESRNFSPLPMDGRDWMNQDWVEVTIRIDLSVMDKVIERFGEGNVISVEGNTCLATYPIIHNEYGYDTLLKFGDKCEIVGPSEVREGFIDYVGRILAKYEK